MAKGISVRRWHLNNSLRVQGLRVRQRPGDTCGSVFSGEGTEPAKAPRQGRRKPVCLEPGRGSRTEVVTTAAPAPSDRMALEAVVKRGFVALVWTSIRFTFSLLFYYTGDLFSSFQYNIKAPIGTIVKNPLVTARDGGDRARFLGWEDSLEKKMATHSSILAWRIPGTEEPCGLQSMESQRVGHDWAYCQMKQNIRNAQECWLSHECETILGDDTHFL